LHEKGYATRIPLGWPERILAAVLAVLLLLLGLAFGILLLGLAGAAALALAGRIWWLRRRLQRAAARRDGEGDGTVIEAEYRVEQRHRDHE
jgi:hypothetical protein